LGTPIGSAPGSANENGEFEPVLMLLKAAVLVLELVVVEPVALVVVFDCDCCCGALGCAGCLPVVPACLEGLEC